MRFNSKNMNYIFNIEYFENVEIPKPKNNDSKESEKAVSKELVEKIKSHNKAIEEFSFMGNDIPVAELENASYEKRYLYSSFRLYTRYPGLLTGIGYPHEVKLNEAIKCGFLFDYVTGLPYLSGSSLKGMLRSLFPGDGKASEVSQEYKTYIIGILNKGEYFDLQGLKNNLFEYNDIFLGVYPDIKNRDEGILKIDYITPHEKFKDPNAISMLKVKPNVPFVFSFLLTDYMVEGNVVISAKEKLDLFKNLILDMGIGAKTNVGFGRFAEKKVNRNYQL